MKKILISFFAVLILMGLPGLVHSMDDSNCNGGVLQTQSGQDDTQLLLQNIQKCIQTNSVLQLEAKVYFIRSITINSGIKIQGVIGKTIIKPIVYSSRLISSSDSLSLTNVIIDASGKANMLIYSSGDLILNNCVLKNAIGDDKNPANGVRQVGIAKYLEISNTTFMDFVAFEDGKSGNSIGANRGVITKQPGRIRILNSKFINIGGAEDGDCIHIQTSGSDKRGWTSAGDALVKGCYFENFGKRGVKIQASDVTVENCIFVSNKIYKRKPLTAIGVFGSRNTISKNNLDLDDVKIGILMTAGSQNSIVGNTIRMGWDRPSDSSLTGIYWGSDSKTEKVKDNNIDVPKASNAYRFSKFVGASARQAIRLGNILKQ